MATQAQSSDRIEIPKLPTGSVKGFIPYLTQNPDTPIQKLLEPYKAFENELRKIYAQQPTHELLQDGTANLVPIYAGHEKEVTIRARALDDETEDEQSKYIMPLSEDERKPNGAPAIVASLKEFQQNFSIFSEQSLAELDWNNVVVAGSACTTCLLPVPEEWAVSKRKLREYYHENFAPASDVDLFLYGLNEEQALEKIKQIERSIKDSILTEVTTIRTKNAITIASQSPTRHVQIVLRLYDSISQIITGFDVDCACAAYDGQQIYAAPRALAAFMTQSNTIDLTRRSPSYENRLSKYSHRGFEVQWPLLDRTRIDPTIFERSFGRTLGLARLLILEKLPKSKERESYMDQRRAERGRPAIQREYWSYGKTGNVKVDEEDEIAEWVEQEEMSSYHTMVVPYGPKFHAGRINRLLYAKDLLLNAEWNQNPKERSVYIHRHPCFFGTAEEVLQDCCGYCPVPKTDEEITIAEQESKLMVSGPLKFIVDDPGRQEIGSFNPITDDEWTTMAYVGDTARLCQAIVDNDLEHVEDWCSQEGVDVNRRDFTGRTPLHLATMVSTPEVVECLVDHGARLIARLVDGRTALHIAATRGDTAIVKILMDRSQANEEEEDEKEDARRAARKAQRAAAGSGEEKEPAAETAKKTDDEDDEEGDSDDESSEASEITLDSEEGSDVMTMGSFVKIDEKKLGQEDVLSETKSDGPDVYEVDVLAWDFGLSPLHYAILNGHQDVIDLLVSEYGADVLLPVKIPTTGPTTATAVFMTLMLTLNLPAEKGKAVAKQLLELGATSAQADMYQVTAFHHVVAQNNADILDVLIENDRPVVMSVLNSVGSTSSQYRPQIYSPLTSSINKEFPAMVSKLLQLGARTDVNYENWVKVHLANDKYARRQDATHIKSTYHSTATQPIVYAAGKDQGQVVVDLLAHGADPSTLENCAHGLLKAPSPYSIPQSVIDVVRQRLHFLRKRDPGPEKPSTLEDEKFYTHEYKEGTYQYMSALGNFKYQEGWNADRWKAYNRSQEVEIDGAKEKRETIETMIRELEHAEKVLIDAGAKTFKELHPNYPENHKEPDYGRNDYVPQKLPAYATTFHFQTPDLSDNKRHGYISLFEGAWRNDLEMVESLTLAPWKGPDSDMQAPLKIAIQDQNGHSPFSIAVLRGHYDLARKILEICNRQYYSDQGPTSRTRWTVRKDGSEDGSEEDSESDDEPSRNLPISSEVVNENFTTMDNQGEVATFIKGDVLPLEMIRWPGFLDRIIGTQYDKQIPHCNLLKYAVMTENLGIFRFILQVGAEQQALLQEEKDDQTCFNVEYEALHQAMLLGHTTLLAEMVKATGVGFPLTDLIKNSGVEIKSKPKFYQGLSVGGKKRADWAQAPGGRVDFAEATVPPLLDSARLGNVDAVAWLMGNEPLRRYKEFVEANKHDKRIKTLESVGPIEKTIGKWLNGPRNLVLHAAILQRPGKQDIAKHLDLLKYIISVAPESLEHKSSDGWTPLQVAVFTQQPDVASYLLSIGANQRNRDRFGRNMVHSMVCSANEQPRLKAEDLEPMIKLFDKDAVKEMLVERCNLHEGALTPLAHWLAVNSQNSDIALQGTDVVRVLARYSTGEDLEMINGAGDLPLHVAVRRNLTAITSCLLELNPSLLYRENATGRTPLEMAVEGFVTSRVSTPLEVGTQNYNYYPGREDYWSHARKDPSTYLKKPVADYSQKTTWEICDAVDKEMGQKEGGRKRRLVSLFEANEVARRVGGGERSAGVEVEVKTDQISLWLAY